MNSPILVRRSHALDNDMLAFFTGLSKGHRLFYIQRITGKSIVPA
jgi:hypothetical protein